MQLPGGLFASNSEHRAGRPPQDLLGGGPEHEAIERITSVHAEHDRIDLALARDWKLGGNWLNSGFNQEQGWSVSLTGPVYGLNLYGEYSKLTQWPNGDDFVAALADCLA